MVRKEPACECTGCATCRADELTDRPCTRSKGRGYGVHCPTCGKTHKREEERQAVEAAEQGRGVMVRLPAFAQPVLAWLKKDAALVGETLDADAEMPDAAPEERFDSLLKQVDDVDANGEGISRLSRRADCRLLKSTVNLLRLKGFRDEVVLFFFWWLHLLYHCDSVAYVIALILAHPDLHPGLTIGMLCERSVELDSVCEALAGIWLQVEGFFKHTRVFQGTLLDISSCEKLSKSAFADSNEKEAKLLQPCRNPSSWNRSTHKDWGNLIQDAQSLGLGRATRGFTKTTLLGES